MKNTANTGAANVTALADAGAKVAINYVVQVGNTGVHRW